MDWVHAFDADHVVAVGDPNNPATSFEIWYTGNASAQTVTWIRATVPRPLDADEYIGLAAYAHVGDTVWTGTVHEPNGVPGPVRILRSTDQGHTWTAHNTPMVGKVEHLAFKDALHGVAFSTQDGMPATPYVMYTTNGGLTWIPVTPPNPATADTVQGKFYQTGIAAIPHVGYISYGEAITGDTRPSNRGASFSPDGLTWTDIDKSGTLYTAADFVQCGPSGFQGYLGGLTAAGSGAGGLYQVTNGCAALATRPATMRPALTAAPNPSADGRFTVQLAEGTGPGTRLAVLDALGRVVWQREWSATGSAVTVPLDLSAQPPGLYTLRLTGPSGAATLKLAIE